MVCLFDGVPLEVGTFPVDTEAARALGAKDLEPETSENLSLGMTYKDDKFSLSVDAYMITVEDRISMSETFRGSGTSSTMVDFFAGYRNQWFRHRCNNERRCCRWFIIA